MHIAIPSDFAFEEQNPEDSGIYTIIYFVTKIYYCVNQFSAIAANSIKLIIQSLS